MAKVGEASILAVADVTKFAAQLQRDLTKAIAGIRLNADTLGRQISDGIATGVTQANLEMRRLGSQSENITNIISANADRAGANMAASFRRVGSQMADIGQGMTMAMSLPIAAAGVATVRTAGNFEQMMQRVKAATESSGPAFEALRQQAIDLGSTTAFSATEAADGMRILSTAGFSVTQIMAALPAVLNMASAGAVELSVAAEIGSNILNGYGFAAADLAKVNDILARTFLSTATDLTDLGESFKYVGPVAKSAGLAFEEVSAAIGLMGNAGIKGSEAGTALRGAIARLLSPTAEVEANLRKLGVSVVDSGGKLLPLVSIIKQLESSGASTADMMTIFGLEAGPAMQALVSQGSTALTGLTAQLNNAGGTADRVAKTQMEGLNGSLDELSSSAEGLMIAIGDAGLLSTVTKLTKGLTGWILEMSKSSPETLNLMVALAGLLLAAGPVLIVIGKVTTAVGVMIPVVKKLVGSLKLFGSSAMAFFATPAGWIVLAVAAVVIALIAAYKYSDQFRAFVQRAFAAVGQAGLWLWNSAIKPAFEGIKAGFQWVVSAAQTLWSQAQPLLRAFGAGFSMVWNSAIKPAANLIMTSLKQIGTSLVGLWNGTFKPLVMPVVAMFATLGSAVGSWWSKNGDAVFRSAAAVVMWCVGVMRTAFNALMVVLRIVAAIVVWAWQNIIIPAIQIAVAIISAVIGVVIAIFVGLWNVCVVVFNAIKTAIGWVVAAAQWWWATFGPIFTAIGSLIWAVWSGVFSVVFGLLKLGFAIVVAAARVLWAALQVAFTAIGAVLMMVWNVFISPVVRLIGAIFSWLWGVISTAALAIGAVFMAMWNSWISPALSAIVSGFQGLWNTIVSVFNAVVNFIKSAVANIVAAANGIAAFVSSVAGYFESMASSVRAKIDAVISFVRGIPGQITSAIGNIGNLLYSAGQNVINGLIEGVSSRIGALKEMISNAAKAIRDHLPFSPAKIGPLSGSGDPTISGGKIINMLGEGIIRSIPALQTAIGLAAGTVASVAPMAVQQAPSLAGGYGRIGQMTPVAAPATSGVTYQITVNALDPKTAATTVMDAITDFERRNGRGWRS